MTLIEPVPFHLLRAAGKDAEWQVIEGVIDAVDEAMARGDRKATAAAYMGFWLGRFQWWMSPGKLKDNIIETVDKVALEFQAAKGLAVPAMDVYTSLDVPTLLIHGAKTPSGVSGSDSGPGGFAAQRTQLPSKAPAI